MDGVLIINKPAGFTSHDVVALVRRRFGLRRVGHTGTLDPMAEGVLVLLVGRATRLAEFLTGHTKRYTAGLVLGLTTDTQDLQGRILNDTSCAEVTLDRLAAVLQEFRGEILQTPPMYSAVKVDGQRLNRLAREGRTVERRQRRVHVYSLEVESWHAGEHARATLKMEVSSGFYVRTLCADIGDRLGTGGAMEWLVRTGSGPFTIEMAHRLLEVEQWTSNDFREHLLPPEAAVQGMPRVEITTVEGRRFCSGLPVAAGRGYTGIVRVHSQTGELLGIGQATRGQDGIRPLKVLGAP